MAGKSHPGHRRPWKAYPLKTKPPAWVTASGRAERSRHIRFEGHMTQHAVYQKANLNVDNPGVQLPAADIAHQTRPGLWDGLGDTDVPKALKMITDAPPGDRMVLTYALAVGDRAQKVAGVLAYHGWVSWPSRRRLADLTGLLPPNVSHGLSELARKGIITRRRRYSSGGVRDTVYVFNGLKVAEVAALGKHPTLAKAARKVLRWCRSDTGASVAPTPITRSNGTGVPLCAEVVNSDVFSTVGDCCDLVDFDVICPCCGRG